MDIYTYLTEDHRKVAKLIDELLSINLQWVQKNIFEQIRMELIAHAAAEEQIFYKAISEASHNIHAEKDIDHSMYEHDDIRRLLQQLSKEAMTSPKWMLMFGELKHAIESHVEQEETEVFVDARAVLSTERAETMVQEMDAEKTRRLMEMPAFLSV